MAKKIGIIIVALVCVLLLAGCGCEHMWLDATCLAPATCKECGKTEGELGDHIWQDATCTAPKTCVTCGATEGEKLEHTLSEATCETPATCQNCGYTKGTPLGHLWSSDGCMEFCTRCNEEKGEHTWVEATCKNKKYCAVCDTTVGDFGDHTYMSGCSKICSGCGLVQGEPTHTLKSGSDGISGVCTVCNKAIEYFIENDNLYAWTEYAIGTNGSYTDPVTYVLDKNKTYQMVSWFSGGTLNSYENDKFECKVFYAQGKVYYFNAYSATNPKAVTTALANAASAYVSWTSCVYNEWNCVYGNLVGPGGWIEDDRGHVYAALDVYGNQFCIVHKSSGSWDIPDDPTQTWAVSCNWQK